MTGNDFINILKHILAVSEFNKYMFLPRLDWNFCPACTATAFTKSGSSSNCRSKTMNFWSHAQVKKCWETKQWDECFLFHGFSCAMVAQSRGWGLKNPIVWPLSFKYFRQFKEKRRPETYAILAPRLYNSYNHAHVPCSHMWQSPGPGPGSKCSKTVEVGCSYSELKPCQREMPLTKCKKKSFWESAAI